MKKGIVRSLLVLCIVLSMAVIPVSAQTKEYYTYSVSNGEATITKVDTSISGDIVVPDTLGGYPVTSIGDEAFWECTNIKSVVIPDSVRNIGRTAFAICRNLESVIIPTGITEICENVFSGCTSLTKVIMPDSLTRIGSYAFSECTNLVNITIPNSVTSIGNGAFAYCQSLESIAIPNGITEISGGIFSECTSITNIEIPGSVTNIGYGAFEYCNSLSNIYYKGSKEDWKKLNIAYENSCFTNAVLHYVPNTTTTTRSTYQGKKEFIVSLTNIEGGSTVILVLYKDGVLRQIGELTYHDGEPCKNFVTDAEYDIAKVMVWDSLDNLKCITNAEIVK